MARLARLSDGLLLAGALVVLLLLVRHQVSGRSGAMIPAPRPVAGWQRFVAGGSRIGSPSAPVTIVEVVDFGCSACAYLHPEIRRLLKLHSGDLAVVYRHFPSSTVSTEAAVAAECAAMQGVFEPVVHELFAQRASFRGKPWIGIARAAGVPDTAEFERCLREGDPIPRVNEDVALARQLGIVAVPSFLIDGELVSHLTRTELAERTRAALARLRRGD